MKQIDHEDDVLLMDQDENDDLSQFKQATSNISIKTLNDQVNQLGEENKQLKNQISELILSANQNNTTVGHQEGIASIEEVLKKEKKVSLLAYSALAFSFLSFVMMIVVVNNTDDDTRLEVDKLSKQIVELKQESNHFVAKELKLDFEKLNRQVGFLTSSRHQISTQLKEMNTAFKIKTLTPVVENLVKKNNAAKHNIKQLSEKLSNLEKRKFLSLVAPSSIKKEEQTVSDSHWIVNLISVKQKSQAVSKAEEFNKKGVSTDVVPVKVNDEDWFRLRVNGFKSKDEADLSVDSIKKKLDLSDVWVAELKQ